MISSRAIASLAAVCLAIVGGSCAPTDHPPIVDDGPAFPQLHPRPSLSDALAGLGPARFATLEYRHEVHDPSRAAPIVVGRTEVRWLESSGPMSCVEATYHTRTPRGAFEHRVTDRVCGVFGLLELLYDSTKHQRPEIRFLVRRDRIEALVGTLARLEPGRELEVVQGAIAQHSRAAGFSRARELTYREAIRVVGEAPLPTGAPAGIGEPCWRIDATTREPDGFEDRREIVFAPSIGASVTTRRVDEEGVAEVRRLVAWTPRDPELRADVR